MLFVRDWRGRGNDPRRGAILGNRSRKKVGKHRESSGRPAGEPIVRYLGSVRQVAGRLAAAVGGLQVGDVGRPCGLV